MSLSTNDTSLNSEDSTIYSRERESSFQYSDNSDNEMEQPDQFFSENSQKAKEAKNYSRIKLV